VGEMCAPLARVSWPLTRSRGWVDRLRFQSTRQATVAGQDGRYEVVAVQDGLGLDHERRFEVDERPRRGVGDELERQPPGPPPAASMGTSR